MIKKYIRGFTNKISYAYKFLLLKIIYDKKLISYIILLLHHL